MFSAQTNTTVVGRLRIRSKSSDPQAEQQRLSRMLRSATLHPAGLPESAMLVVRRLADPLPSRLRAAPFDTLPDPSWQRAVTASLQELAASAARPAYGPVPAESNAVLFYDRAEILAALALDWMSGTLTSQWWWRELLRGHDAISALLREWVQTPQYVPPAMELLAHRQRIVQFVQRLPEPAAIEMLNAMIRIYGVPRPDPQEAVPQANSADSREQPIVEAVISVRTKTRHHSPAHCVPWLAWVPEASTPGLSVPRKMLLIQALMLRRAPAIVRTISFQKALLQWQAAAKQSEGTDNLPAEALPPQFMPEASEEAAETSKPVARSKPAHSFPTRQAPKKPQRAVTFAKPARSKQNEEPGKIAPRQAQHENIAPPEKNFGAQALADQPAHIAEPFRPEDTSEQQITVKQESAVAQSSQRELVEPPAVEPEASIESSISLETEYGGVFFLLSLALYLHIYSDFTGPGETGLELNIWDFLALMASEFTGGNVENDRLWPELAALAGRTPSQLPGLAFDPPNEWRLPQDWLEPFPEDYDRNPVLINGRMVLVHPAGFTVLDVPASENTESEPLDHLQRWVGWMAAYLRARLIRALGCEDAAEFLCRLPAHVSLTLTHLDVTFSLNHHPIEVRMAGLDRNLGWIPAAGRYVAFHFE
jgi:hypothetical protein